MVMRSTTTCRYTGWVIETVMGSNALLTLFTPPNVVVRKGTFVPLELLIIVNNESEILECMTIIVSMRLAKG